MMSILMLFLVVLIGMAGGILYFGGLWLTVSKLPQSRRPYLLSIVSFLGRMAGAILLFYLVARNGDWQQIIACLAGFLLARVVFIRHYQLPHSGKERTHEY